MSSKTSNKLCVICKAKQEEDSIYCKKHYKAYLELKKGYKEWTMAYGHLTWDEYLKKLQEKKWTGKFILEVIEHELFFKNSRK